MDAFITVYVSAYGEIRMPERTPVRMRRDFWPDMRYRLGRRYAEYLVHLERLAQQEYMAGRQLRVAPSYSAWAAA